MIDLAAAMADEPIRAGQYLLVTTEAWWLATVQLPERSPFRCLAEVIDRRWIPFGSAGDRLTERQVTGRQIWINGSDAEAAEAGVRIGDSWPTGRWRTPAPVDEPSWQTPTPEFLAALPRDPDQLLTRLHADSPDNGPGYTGAFAYATDVLRTGLVPGDLRAALYTALLTLPGAELAELAEPDGRRVSLLLNDGPRRCEILIDRTNGQFAGERSTVTEDIAGFRAGTVTTSTVVTTAVVDSVG
jgi:hypothetical protein